MPRYVGLGHDLKRAAVYLQQAVKGKTNVEGLMWLGELVQMAPPGLLVDLGTYWGRSAMMMAIAGQVGSRDTWRKVLTIDNYREGPDAKLNGGPYPNIWAVQHTFADMPLVHLCMRNTTPVPEIAILNGPLALVFVDDDHSEAGVSKVCEHWIYHVPEGGIMAFDDYGNPRWPDVKPTVDKYMDGWQSLGVRGSVAAYRRGA